MTFSMSIPTPIFQRIFTQRSSAKRDRIVGQTLLIYAALKGTKRWSMWWYLILTALFPLPLSFHAFRDVFRAFDQRWVSDGEIMARRKLACCNAILPTPRRRGMRWRGIMASMPKIISNM